MENILSALLFLAASLPTFTGVETPLDQWVPASGDQFIVDTELNRGYLLHEDGSYTSFIVATGQQRRVHYLGRTYNAATPERDWIVKSDHIQSDRITFGKSGFFLRLYSDNGSVSTPYGIHGHAYSDRILSREDRFASMGCIIVSDDILSIIEETYELNGKELRVKTQYGLVKKMTTTP